MKHFTHSRGFDEEENLSAPRGRPVSLIREEFVRLTGHHAQAVILSQLLYWTQRTKDFSLMLEEEKTKTQKGDAQDEIPHYGWIYKTATELGEETLLSLDRTTIRRHLLSLINRGWVFERKNPHNKWDKTRQYRINPQQLQKDLMDLGFSLSDMALSGLEKLFLRDQKSEKKPEAPSNVIPLPVKSRTIETWNGHCAPTRGHPAHSNGQIARSKTEITSEITNKESTARAKKKFFEDVCEIWNTHIRQEGLPREGVPQEGSSLESSPRKGLALESPLVRLTAERRRRIESLFPLYFQNDLKEWNVFCNRIAQSPFLMGQGTRKWRVSLDWILIEANLLKVLEGNFDEDTFCDQHTQTASQEVRDEEIKSLLESIEDPLWRKVCSQVDFTLKSHTSLSLRDLKIIADARILEIEDERLAWIGSKDVDVLSHIEHLRLHLLSPLQRLFPHLRNFRTRLETAQPSFQERSSTLHNISFHSLHPQS